MSDTHSPETCERPDCEPCLDHERHESIVRLELALLDLETSQAGERGAWVDLDLRVDALDIRNVLDLLRLRH